MKNGLVIGALAIGALLLLGGKNTSTSTCAGRWVKLPSGEIVCETALPALGYILYSDGKYYHRSQFQPPAGSQYAGVNTNTQQWQGILTNLISQGVNLFQRFHYTQGGEPEPWAGDAGGSGAGGDNSYDPTGTGGNDPYGGIGIITVTPNGMTRWICRDGRYSTAHGQGACTNHRGILYKHKK